MQQNLRACEADVRWVRISSIHLTLKFLGEIDPEIIPRLAEALRPASELKGGLRLRIKDLGCFPNHKTPRVIWCGLMGDTDSLINLQKRVETACSNLGFGSEKRPFHPHLTLGRVRGKRNLQSLLECIKIGFDAECEFGADHYNIYRSTLKREGAVYSVVETIRLSTP